MNSTIIRVNHNGRLANRMAQMMFVRDLQKLCVRRLVAVGYDLPEWSLTAPRSEHRRTSLSVGSHLTRIKIVAALIDRFKPRCFNLDHVVLRVGNYTSAEGYADLFPLKQDDGIAIPNDRLLIHIRAGDVSTYTNPRYGPLPISYYQYLSAQTGLRPTFIGEIEPTPYIEALRTAFPKSELIGGVSAFSDFQTIRRAKHVAIAVSTFSWLASYLSHAENIHVPVAGILDPRAMPDADVLPVRDHRYTFHDIPVDAWTSRYEELFPPVRDFSVMTPNAVDRLKKRAVQKTLILNTRVHLGIARRMAFDQ